MKFETQEERVRKVRQWKCEYRNPYPCTICGKRFKSKTLVLDHKQQEHAY